MKRACPLLLLLPLVLSACQDREARAQNAELSRRVAALERGVTALKLKVEAGPVPDADAQSVTMQAAAQNCANDLTRALELYRQDSIERRYPTRAELTLPDACAEQRVRWEKLEPQAYTFTLLGRARKSRGKGAGAGSPIDPSGPGQYRHVK